MNVKQMLLVVGLWLQASSLWSMNTNQAHYTASLEGLLKQHYRVGAGQALTCETIYNMHVKRVGGDSSGVSEIPVKMGITFKGDNGEVLYRAQIETHVTYHGKLKQWIRGGTALKSNRKFGVCMFFVISDDPFHEGGKVCTVYLNTAYGEALKLVGELDTVSQDISPSKISSLVRNAWSGDAVNSVVAVGQLSLH